MSAAGKSSRAVLLFLVLCSIASTPTYSQSSMLFNASKLPGNRTSSGAWLAKCEPISMNVRAEGRYNDGTEWPPVGKAIPGDLNLPDIPVARCVELALPAPPRVSADNPCRPDGTEVPAAPGALPAVPCSATADIIPAELSGLGKAGVKIARAREEVLEILRSENACTEWFATKDRSPADTFQSLNFLLDQRGQRDVFESNEAQSMVIFRQPYVARVTQDGGAHTAITINAHGAFYRPQGSVLKVAPEGGPLRADGTRLLMVGSYRGDTLRAQMLTLLHEFGHVIDLLPQDADNLDGKSVRNTDTVLRHCRAEIDERAKQSREAATVR